MHTYHLSGIVRPERAQISWGHPTEHPFKLVTPQGEAEVNIHVVLNQISVWVKSNFEWPVLDLRNTVAELLNQELAIVGFLKGYAYDLEITRITNGDRSLDMVFGIEIPCIGKKMEGKFSSEAFTDLLRKSFTPNGFILHRCFTDLTLAMKHPVDTPFYCYRALEALRLHHNAGKDEADKKRQWERFREFVGISKEMVDFITAQANAVRHGELIPISDEQRADLFNKTWDIVETYLNKIPTPA